ncbi:MAG: transglutaminase-like domain-containing protein [Clostridiales bacterium]|nr:transglutaminase-like domain-containing protein [Clostridiales bacterium]
MREAIGIRKAEEYFFSLPLCGLLTFSLSFTILNATIIPVSMKVLILAILGYLVLYAIIFYNHYTFLAFLALLAASASFIYFNRVEMTQADGILSEIMAYAEEVMMFIRGYTPYDESYGTALTVVICGFMTFYMILAVYVTFQFYFVAILGFGTFAVNWIMNYRRSEMGFMIFLFCFLVLVLKKLNKKRQNKNVLAMYMTPVCLIVVAASYALPHRQAKWDNGAAMEFFNDPLSATSDFFYFMFNPKYFSFQTTGFENNSGRLGGSISLNNRYIMEVRTSHPTYLAGSIRDTYTGYSWTNKDGEFDEPYNRSAAQSELTESRLSLPFTVDFTNVEINIGESRTGTLFRPMKSFDVDIESDLDIYANELGDLRMSDVLPANSSYSFQYLDVDYASENVKSVLRQSYRGIYLEAAQNDMYYEQYRQRYGEESGWSIIEEPSIALEEIWGQWESVYREGQSRRSNILLPSQYFANTLVPYAEYVYENFTEVPETLPQRVVDLAREITAGALNNYDRAKAVEDYLVQFPYTLTPGPAPRDQDFVDYFLFDGKEGYCTYYASAMAVMCRTLGIPSRYMEGYILPTKATRPGVYTVTNLQAHAWAEVYLEGFGWTPFEATAPYSYSFNEKEAPASDSIFTPDFASDPDYLDYIEDMIGYNASDYVPAARPTAAPQGSSAKNYIPIFVAIGACAAGFLGFCLLVLKGSLAIESEARKVRRMTLNQQVIEHYKGIIKMTRYYHYPMINNETPAAYSARVGKRFAFKNDMIFIRDLTQIYYKAKYANTEVQRGDAELLSSCRKELLAFIRTMRSAPVFIWNRYITRKI